MVLYKQIILITILEMIFLIILFNLLFIQKTTGIIEKNFLFLIQQEIMYGMVKAGEFYEIILYADHINPHGIIPLAVTRTQGIYGIATSLKIILNQQIYKFTVCAQRFRRFRTIIAQSSYIKNVPAEEFSIPQNCGYVETQLDSAVVRFVYGFLPTNIFTGYTVLQIPNIPSHKISFNIQIVDNEFVNGTKYFFHFQCASRLTNNFYLETKMGEKIGQIEFMDEICEGNLYKIGVIVTQNTTLPLGFKIKKEINRPTKCPNPETNNKQFEFNYELVIINNSSAELPTWTCNGNANTNTKPKRRRINEESDGAGPSLKRELSQNEQNKINVPIRTQDFLSNFVGSEEQNEQQPNGQRRNFVETLNLLDNFLGGHQQQQTVESQLLRAAQKGKKKL